MELDIEAIIQDDLIGRTYPRRREKDLRRYYSNPNYCRCCGNIIVMQKDDGPVDAWNKKFCCTDCFKKYKQEHPEINIPKKFLGDECFIDKKVSLCLNCKTEIAYGKKYCSNECLQDHRQKEFEEQWFASKISGNNDSIWKGIRTRVRKYLFNKYDGKCARCGWGETNPFTGTIPLEVEHIDGNPYNTTPENVTLLCPNCHSLTATYCGANRGNGRAKTWIPKLIDVDI